MAEFSVIRRKGKSKQPSQVQDLTQEDQSSLLSKAGAGAMSGLHTLGSILSWPSRLLHGGINAAVGGKEGFGENYLNPFDSRGSVEGSRHLINAGIIPENDPNTWEWGDFGRGLIDLALDPTTYAGPGLTKLGLQAGKKGTLAAGRVAQTANKQRALLNVGLPFMEPAISIGTGAGTAKALSAIGNKTGLARVSKAIGKSAPVRYAKGLFNSFTQGLTHPVAQEEAIRATNEMRKLQKASQGDIYRAARDEELAKFSPEELRMGFEGAEKSAVQGGYVPHPATATDPLEPHVMLHINPQGKIVEHFPDAADTGVLDDVLAAGTPIKAPFLHLDDSGKPVLGKGKLHSKKIRPMANKAFKQEQADILARANKYPMFAEQPFSIAETLRSKFPGSLNTELIPFRELSKATGKTPQEIVEALQKELPEGYSLHKHDFPSEIVHEGKQGEFFWRPKEPGDIGSYDTPFIGVSLRSDTGTKLAGMPPAPNVPHPEWQKEMDEYYKLNRKGKTRKAEHAARIAAEIQAAHGSDEALAVLAKMRDLKEPGMAVMVPKSQVEQIRRQFAGGPKERIASDITKAVRGSNEYKNIATATAEMLERQRERGFGLGEELNDPAVSFFPRRQSVTDAEAAGSLQGSGVMPAKTAEDTGRKWIYTGFHEGAEGVNKLLSDPALHDAASSGGVKAVYDTILQKYGHTVEQVYQDAKQRHAVSRTAKTLSKLEAAAKATEQKIADQAKLADALRADPANAAALRGQEKKLRRYQKKLDEYKQKFADATVAHENALSAGHDRFKALAKHISQHPEMKGVKKFGNDPLYDYKVARLSNDRKYAMAGAVARTISQELNKGDQSVTLLQFIKDKGYKMRPMAEQIAGRQFDSAKELKKFLTENTIDSHLDEQLKSIAPAYKGPAAAGEVAKAFKSGMAWWKGLTLAFPASRVRDAVGGVVQNVLHGWADPTFITQDAKLLLTGKVIKRDYSHVPEIQEWLRKSGKEWSPENQTEALRQMVATHLPSDHSILADVPTGQIGAGREQLTKNIPGQKETTMFNQFIGDPLRALMGRDPGGASWFGRAEPGETALQRVGRAVKQPFTGVRGVGDLAETAFAPVKASEIVAANSDAYNRVAPFMQQIHGGTAADVAAGKVNRAQIDYDPETFSATERAIKNYVAPFWSFNSRIIPETARELSNFGSPTSQLIKTIDRSHGGGDASVPDYVMSGTGIPLGTRSDGSKSYLTGLGQMYEPAVSQLGLLAGGLVDPRSLGAAGYDTLAQLNPMLGTPLQRITGQSFFQRGEPISNLDPIAGRTISNIGESIGLRDKDQGPVKFPGSAYVDTILGATPFGRAVGQVRTLADPRKDALSKLVDTMSGARVTDISPEKQMATLQKRAEDLARSQGAWEQRTVGFPKEQLAKLALTNPGLAAEQQHLQNLITAMKRKRTLHRKKKKAAEAAKK